MQARIRRKEKIWLFLRSSIIHHTISVKIGLIRERKNPPDKRVAFTPEQCHHIYYNYPDIQFIIEPSEVRCIPDEMYQGLGFHVGEEMETCDVLFGIKEVPPQDLIFGKTYFMFSHTIKKQAHNQKLLHQVLEKNITLVDYECLVNEKGERTVAFGRFAGIVGAYNALRMWMFRFHQIPLKPAHECGDMEEMMDYARHHLSVLEPIKIAITGTGRVGKGAKEVLDALGIKEVEPDDYLTSKFEEPVYTLLSSRHYYQHPEMETWDEAHFRKNAGEYESRFLAFSQCIDLFIPCHYWDPKAPPLFTRKEVQFPEFQIKVISDVTCDLEGSVPTTIRTSTIADPFYDINPNSFGEEPAFSQDKNITICAIDNLPCELPFDASKAFGEMLMENVLPELASGNWDSIEKATITRNGKLTTPFHYLESYAYSAEKAESN
jgi:saccharopine dehydrogenase (NAD+, L-lysine-forming)